MLCTINEYTILPSAAARVTLLKYKSHHVTRLLNSLMTSHHTDNKIQIYALTSQGLASGIFSNSAFITDFPIHNPVIVFSSVQFSLSVMSDSLQPHESQHSRHPCPSPTPGVYPDYVHWVSDAIQPSYPLSPLLLLPPIPPSIRVFSNESTLHMRWPKYWSFSFSIIPSKEISGLISFRMD